MSRRRLLVGIGSSHGDDAVGWAVAERVAAKASATLEVRCARTPAELFDWLDDLDGLDVCDALVGPAAGTVTCWTWPTAELERAPFRGSHDLSLLAVLAIADRLGRLPPQVRVWGIAVQPVEPGTGLSPAAEAVASAAADRICAELAAAPKLTCGGAGARPTT